MHTENNYVGKNTKKIMMYHKKAKKNQNAKNANEKIIV